MINRSVHRFLCCCCRVCPDHRRGYPRLVMAELKAACWRTCRCFLRAFLWIPVAFVIAIVAWAYYVYVFVFNLLANEDVRKPIPVIILLLLVAHILLFLQLSSYFRTIFTKHKDVPKKFEPTDEQLDRLDDMVDARPYLKEISKHLPIHTVTRSNAVRYCGTCEVFKPDRSHHCSTCGRCILKMDHHCPWVNNCVGYSNYKFFILFLMYTVILCLWFSLSGMYDFVQVWGTNVTSDVGSKFNVTFCYIIVTVFSLSTGCLLVFHLYLVLVNRTTIENMDPVHIATGDTARNMFHVGYLRNLQSVFGHRLLFAFLPLQTSEGDGATFPMRNSHVEAGLGTRTYTIVDNDTDEEEVVHDMHRPLATNGLRKEYASGSDSEVDIFAVTDERQPLTPSTHTS